MAWPWLLGLSIVVCWLTWSEIRSDDCLRVFAHNKSPPAYPDDSRRVVVDRSLETLHRIETTVAWRRALLIAICVGLAACLLLGKMDKFVPVILALFFGAYLALSSLECWTTLPMANHAEALLLELRNRKSAAVWTGKASQRRTARKR